MEIVIKLDRLKLPNASDSSAENVFQQISKDTGAVVLWESGSKTFPVRREPCIKISGAEESVNKARDMLLEKLEIHSNRVVMKLEVNHLEHPSLIGKGGKLIKKVMEATGCHIHFPDANKCSIHEKKNQVSIYGDPINVERARVMIRALIPIQIHFKVPKTSLIDTQVLKSVHSSYDYSLPETKFLGSYNGLLLYSAQRQSNNIVIVRCNQDQFSRLRKDITNLMELVCCTNGANLPPVHMVTDIMQQHHLFVKGSNNSNIEGIVKRTGAKITFPDVNSPNPDRRSIKIWGSLDSVYVAWLEIMNFLPVSVSFDVNGTRETNGEYMDFLRDLGITLFTRPNPKYYIKSVTLKGPEKFSKQMLQYRQHLLHLPSLCFKADMEDINLASNFLTSLSEYFQSPAASTIPSSVTNIISRNIGIESLHQLTQDLNNTAICKQFLGLTNNSVLPVITNGSIINKDQIVETGYYIADPKDFKMQPSPLFLAVEQGRTSGTGQTIHNENGCCWKSKMGENSNSQDQLLINNNWIRNIPFENRSSGFGEMSRDRSLVEESGNSSRLPQSIFMEKQDQDTTLAEDYYKKKVLAARAMRRPIESMESAQVPTSLWAGYGFSQSMPAVVIKDSLQSVNQYNRYQFNSCSSNSSSEDSESWENVVMKDCIDGDIWSNKKESAFSHSNYFDFLRNMHLPFDNTTKDILPELLWQHGLHKYIDTFTKEEIDFQSFLLLTDNDLQIMGIAHQARVKLVCLIRELQESTMKYKTFDAAPGAERKSSIDRLDNLQIC